MSATNLFDKLSLRNWFKYLLYSAGVLLILSLIVGTKIPINQVISFSFWTIVLMITVWILDDLFFAVSTKETINQYLAGTTIVQLIAFFVWILLATRTLLI